MYCLDLGCWQLIPCTQHVYAPHSQGKKKTSKYDKKSASDLSKQNDEWKNFVSAPISKDNARFEAFYRPLLPDESEWELFLATLRAPLPVSFRLNSNPGFHKFLITTLKTKFLADTQQEEYVTPQSIPWSPLAWQVASSRKGLRHELPEFRSWLVRHFESGSINRQEVVSMIPPLLLDVQPHHYVLDMCAAPGSKTAQLLEALHANKGSVPSGFVWANDADSKRASLLGHQLSRLNSTSVLVTSHAAQNLPTLTWPDREGNPRLLFDRIVCDVPCSGDGTMRKNPEIWSTWDANQHGLGLHTLQLKIATRGIQLLARGGLMTYSTCSFSPLENEAVVASLLSRFPDEIELVDCTGRLPGLQWRAGLLSWPVEEHHLPSMRPPSQALPLQRCLRVFPHLQDTGGFFVALFRRTATKQAADLEGERKRQARNTDSADAPEGKAAPQKGTAAAAKFVVIDEDEYRSLFSSYGLCSPPDSSSSASSSSASSSSSPSSPSSAPSDSPCAPSACLMSREHLFVSAADPRKVKLVSPPLARLIAGTQRGLWIQTLGLRVFQQDAVDVRKARPVPFRVCQEGVYHVIQHASKRVLTVSVEEFRRLLASPPSGGGPETMLECANCALFEALEVGSLVAVVHTPFLAPWDISRLAVCLLKTKALLKVYVAEEWKHFYNELLDVAR